MIPDQAGPPSSQVERDGVLLTELAVTSHERAGATVVHIRGEIDVHTGPALRSRLVELIADGRTRLVVDLTDVDFLDSTALGVLIGAHRRVRALDGCLDVVVERPQVARLFHITGLDKVLALHSDVDAALAAQAARVG